MAVEELEELLQPLEAEIEDPVDYKGSLDYIDSLSEPKPSLTVSKSDILAARDTLAITNDLFDDFTAQSLPADNRRFNPTTKYDFGELKNGASKLVDLEVPQRDDPFYYEERILNPRRLWLSPTYHKRPLSQQSRFSARLGFKEPDKLEICIKRKVRREIMHALGVSGMYWPKRRYSPFSFIRC